MKKKKKVRWNNVILILIMIISIVFIIISITRVIKWNEDNQNTEKIIEETLENVTIEEVEEDIEPIEVKENIPKENPYWDYIKMSLIHVDFRNLKQKNSDTIGWIQVNGTNINYPFVQTSNNDYYLKHSFDKSYNYAGWVFLDYRNNISKLDKNTIIYAHGRLDNTMFGSLKNILTSGWLNNAENHVIKLSTEKEDTLWQVFSVYHIPTTNDYTRISFASDNTFVEFANTLINRSQYDFQTAVEEDDYILTLSTCYKGDEKVVLHAKLIKKNEN